MPVKCKNCGVRLQNNRASERLIINDNEIGIQCIHCWSVHSWSTGKLIKGGEKDSKKN